MSKHTPGPWIRNAGLHSEPMEYVRVESKHEHSIVNDGRAICNCNGPDSEANGLLIAAAPDLLEACEEMYGYFGPSSGYDGKAREALRKAEVVIVKAKGEVRP